MKTLVLGGMRSGKTRLAQGLATATGRPVTYLATARAGDREMAARIAAHRTNRPAAWRVVEVPVKLGDAVANAGTGCVIIDCITLWLANLLEDERTGVLERERDALLDALSGSSAEIIIVSNEISMGVIPLGELNRRYCDAAGMLHQDLARACDRVVLTVAGLPHVLKGETLEC